MIYKNIVSEEESWIFNHGPNQTSIHGCYFERTNNMQPENIKNKQINIRVYYSHLLLGREDPICINKKTPRQNKNIIPWIQKVVSPLHQKFSVKYYQVKKH